jgi:hypothetical protein
MVPLTVDDLLPLEEYAARRREFFESHRRYLDRYRRVRIGPRLTLIFENRQTLWFRVQEVVRIARLADQHEVEQELDLYNRLLPGKNLLQAALLLEIADEARLGQELTHWRNLCGDHLRLCVGAHAFPATLVTCRPEDRCAGTAHWVQFAIEPDEHGVLGDLDLPAHFLFDNGYYQHASATLSGDLRQSLLHDLELSVNPEPKGPLDCAVDHPAGSRRRA